MVLVHNGLTCWAVVAELYNGLLWQYCRMGCCGSIVQWAVVAVPYNGCCGSSACRALWPYLTMGCCGSVYNGPKWQHCAIGSIVLWAVVAVLLMNSCGSIARLAVVAVFKNRQLWQYCTMGRCGSSTCRVTLV
jgi:hypothetical protein